MISHPLTSDPLRNFKFTVNIMLNQNGVNQQFVKIGFMQSQGLGIAIEPLTYREGGDNTTTRKMPGQADFNPVTLTHGMFAGTWNAWYWMQTIFSVMQGGPSSLQPVASPPYVASSLQPDFRTTVYVNVLEHPNTANTYTDANALTVVSIKLFSAWIMGLAFSDFDAGGNAVAIEQMQLAYEGFDMQWGSAGNGNYVNPAIGW